MCCLRPAACLTRFHLRWEPTQRSLTVCIAIFPGGRFQSSARNISRIRMDLFTFMEEDVYQLAIEHSKDNPFRRYLDYLNELGDLIDSEMRLYNSVGKEFINVL